MITATILDKPERLVARGDMLFCLCSECCCEVNWRHVDATHELNAACCSMTFVARPAREDCRVYVISTKPLADASNVVRFRRPAPNPTMEFA